MEEVAVGADPFIIRKTHKQAFSGQSGFKEPFIQKWKDLFLLVLPAYEIQGIFPFMGKARNKDGNSWGGHGRMFLQTDLSFLL